MPQFVILNSAEDQPEARRLCHVLGPPGGVSVNVESYDPASLSFGAHLPLVVIWSGAGPEKARAQEGLLSALRQNGHRAVLALQPGAIPPDNFDANRLNLLRLTGSADQDGPALAAALRLANPGLSTASKSTNASRGSVHRGRLAVVTIGGVIAGGVALAAWAALALVRSVEEPPKPRATLPVEAPVSPASVAIENPVPGAAAPAPDAIAPQDPARAPGLKGSLSVNEEPPPTTN